MRRLDAAFDGRARPPASPAPFLSTALRIPRKRAPRSGASSRAVQSGVKPPHSKTEGVFRAIQPTRLERAKRTFSEFIDKNPHSSPIREYVIKQSDSARLLVLECGGSTPLSTGGLDRPPVNIRPRGALPRAGLEARRWRCRPLDLERGNGVIARRLRLF